MDKAPDAFRTISEVADDLDVPQHVLRFWETRFAQIRPMKRSGGRRYYRPDDVDLLRGIRRLLYGEGYTIRGVQRILKEHGVKAVQAFADGAPLALAPASHDEAARRPDENTTVEAETGDIDDSDEGDLAEASDADSESGAAARAHGPQVRPPQGASPDAPAARAIDGAARALDAAALERLRAALDDLLACRAALDQVFKAQPGKPLPE